MAAYVEFEPDKNKIIQFFNKAKRGELSDTTAPIPISKEKVPVPGKAPKRRQQQPRKRPGVNKKKSLKAKTVSRKKAVKGNRRKKSYKLEKNIRDYKL
jgi:hypothetical protein